MTAAHPRPAAPDSAIEVAGLVKTYGDVHALDGIDFAVPRGQILGLLGPNASGKTTTVSILATLQRPSAGVARIDGYDVTAHPGRVRELISLTGQYAALMEGLTAAENLSFFGRLTGLRRGDVARRTAELVELFDLGEVADRRVGQLSGGMRRRVDIAAALVTRPSVLFLDEPTTGLDPRSRNAVWETVAGLRAEGITVLLTTQYLEEADRLADSIVMLGAGKVVAAGTPEELKSQAGAQTCELVLAPGTDPAAVAALLGSFTLLPRTDDGVLAVRAPDGMATVAEVIEVLQTARIDVADIGLRRPSLDDVFLQLTDAG
ncbi:ATP-binding cassette domain-containing protein [Gordonia sp. FQ]|uniref:ATP-binding cassette domain-containing protein n=1 Tax=Gordonia sp. FQ TaxID=3446634 RepID=UPI003F849CCC